MSKGVVIVLIIVAVVMGFLIFKSKAKTHTAGVSVSVTK